MNFFNHPENVDQDILVGYQRLSFPYGLLQADNAVILVSEILLPWWQGILSNNK